jgi:redox-sensitive bicupin YhaK (pirin superfamily)
MLDHLGPVQYGPGEAVGAPDHPHRGFETVTYILSGGMQHKDSQGNSGTLSPGWVQWMTGTRVHLSLCIINIQDVAVCPLTLICPAGSGVIHSEMPSKELLENGGKMEGFQLWVNLPAKDKMVPPRYQDTPPERIPKVTTPDGKTKVSSCPCPFPRLD